MSHVSPIFERIEKVIKIDTEKEFITAVCQHVLVFKDTETTDHKDSYRMLKKFLNEIIKEIDVLTIEIKRSNDVLISVKNQKTLRTCFQIISLFGITSCLIPGLGISSLKRCMSAQSLPKILLSDDEKYDILLICTDFMHRSYEVPVLKNIIITFHLIDYLSALIQLAFAPLKKPGIYPNFTMTTEKYDRLNNDRQKYIKMYEYLVGNCFQPMLMKELLVLQNVAEQKTPFFVKKVIAKEMSRRLTVPGGLLSLIRCFIDSQDVDAGLEWKKIDMISKIISTKHGNMDDNEYLNNITNQLRNIFSINNLKYLVTAISCVLSLHEKFRNFDSVQNLIKETFGTLTYDNLLSKSNLPGTIILTPQEVDQSIRILHASVCLDQLHTPNELLSPNLYILFYMAMITTKSDIKTKITDIIVKALELIEDTNISDHLNKILFGVVTIKYTGISIEEFEAGLTIKSNNTHVVYPTDDAVTNFLVIFNTCDNTIVIYKLLEACLKIFVEVNAMRNINVAPVREILGNPNDDNKLLNFNDEKYAYMLKILSEICSSQKVVTVLRSKPNIVINFVESILIKSTDYTNDECMTIALILLNTILTNINICDLKEQLNSFIPKLQNLADSESAHIKILCKESISLILSEKPKAAESLFEKSILNVFDDLLPVRAHGIIELNQLINMADPETISKRHYVFCLLQEQLKDSDSYIYLSAINCIASLASFCTSDVINVLCKEYLDVSTDSDIESKEKQLKAAELRMKIGDIIVKVTRNLGEMAAAYKTILLNTTLCVCRDDDPLLRASALSNLAEIALVLHYKMGSIIYEVLLCIWAIIDTDKAVECRRAAVMVITSLIKGLGKDALIELKDNLLPIYRTLNNLYKDSKEDPVVKLHAQLTLEELNDIVKDMLFKGLPTEKEISMLTGKKDIVFK